MKHSFFLYALVATASALQPISLSFDKQQSTDTLSSAKGIGELFKRKNPPEVSLDLINRKTFYTVDLLIGTPPQKINVQLDTGSSDLWIIGSNNPFCQNATTPSPTDPVPPGVIVKKGIDCAQDGTFDSSQSSSYKKNDTNFWIQYVDTTFASGPWGQDKLQIGDVDVSGLSFAIGEYSNSTNAVLGIGLQALESTVGSKPPFVYDNFPIILKRNDLIKRVVYSLFLDDPTATKGQVLFGAVDRSKYNGILYSLPLVNTYASYNVSKATQFYVTLQGLGYISADGNNQTITGSQATVLLDSGTTFSVLPPQLVQLIASKLGALWSPGLGYYLLDCAHEKSNEFLVFDFGGFHIKAPLSAFVVNKGGVCFLGIQPINLHSGVGILGDNFLSYAYVVYDLERHEISMAQAVFSSESNVEFVSGDIPGAEQAPGYSSTWEGWAITNAAPSTFETTGDIFTLNAPTSEKFPVRNTTTLKPSSTTISSGYLTNSSSVTSKFTSSLPTSTFSVSTPTSSLPTSTLSVSTSTSSLSTSTLSVSTSTGSLSRSTSTGSLSRSTYSLSETVNGTITTFTQRPSSKIDSKVSSGQTLGPVVSTSIESTLTPEFTDETSVILCSSSISYSRTITLHDADVNPFRTSVTHPLCG